jgi:hypothetical protein
MAKTIWTVGDNHGGQVLSETDPSDNIYAQHINEMRESINKLEDLAHFGAIRNAADFSNDINLADDDLGDQPGSIFCPPGEFTMTKELQSPYRYIVGCGKDNTVISLTQSATNMLTYISKTALYNFFGVKDLRLRGNGLCNSVISLTQDYSYLEGLDLSDAVHSCIYSTKSHAYITRVNTNLATYALYSYTDFIGSILDNFRNNTCLHGVNLDHQGDLNPQGVIIKNSEIFAPGGNGVQIVDGQFCVIDKTVLDVRDVGVKLLSGSFGGCIQTKILHNYINGSSSVNSDGNGIIASAGSGDLTIDDNCIENFKGWGIQIQASVSAYVNALKMTKNVCATNTIGDAIVDSNLHGDISGNTFPHTTRAFEEVATYGNATNIVQRNTFGHAPVKSPASHYSKNWGDDI